jgi:hypothetical protein
MRACVCACVCTCARMCACGRRCGWLHTCAACATLLSPSNRSSPSNSCSDDGPHDAASKSDSRGGLSLRSASGSLRWYSSPSGFAFVCWMSTLAVSSSRWRRLSRFSCSTRAMTRRRRSSSSTARAPRDGRQRWRAAAVTGLCTRIQARAVATHTRAAPAPSPPPCARRCLPPACLEPPGPAAHTATRGVGIAQASGAGNGCKTHVQPHPTTLPTPRQRDAGCVWMILARGMCKICEAMWRRRLRRARCTRRRRRHAGVGQHTHPDRPLPRVHEAVAPDAGPLCALCMLRGACIIHLLR